jgi:hypothetical protein
MVQIADKWKNNARFSIEIFGSLGFTDVTIGFTSIIIILF